MKKVLILNDFVSWGRLAGSQVDAILTYKDYDVMFLPTALISNMFSMGGISVLDTSEYLEETLDKWAEMGQIFDAVFIGYLKNARQKDLIKKFLKSLDHRPLIVHDPIMADHGALYKGLDPNIVEIQREVAEFSDILIPNFTEAGFLAGNDEKDVEKIVKTLGKDGKKVIITSVKDEGIHKIISYSENRLEEIPYDHIDKAFAGTGDIFDGIFLASFLESKDFKKSIIKAKDIISKILKDKIKRDEESIDIRIEKYLEFI